MNPNIKTFVVVILLLFFDISSGNRVKGFGNGVNPANPSSEVIVDMKIMRELVGVDALLDYEKPIPNPKHDRGRPGGN